MVLLLVAALWLGWPGLRQTPLSRYLAGECEWLGRHQPRDHCR